MQKIVIEHRKYSSVIQILPLHKPQKNEKKELRITHTYGIKISVIMWMYLNLTFLKPGDNQCIFIMEMFVLNSLGHHSTDL